MGLRLQTSTQWGAIKKIIATQPGVRYRVKLGYVHGGSVGGGMEVYNGGVESTQSIGGSGWLNKTTERVFEFVPDSDMVMLKFFSGEVTGVEANMYLSKVEISIANSNHYSRIRGDKTYELSNHLGNVLATITDRKLGFSNNTSNNIATHYQAEVTSATDYYPFGSPMSKRSVFDYKSKYGFNGQEKENEITEITGTHYSAEYWMYDSRLGRRWNVDPVIKEHESPYATFANNPIWFKDPNGADTTLINSEGKVVDTFKGNSSIQDLFYRKELDNGKFEWHKINLNDPKTDSDQLSKSFRGQQLVRFLNFEEVNWIMRRQGADDADINMFNSYIYLGLGSHTDFDFGYRVLAPQLEDKYKSTFPKKYDYSIWDKAGGFIMFTNASMMTAYNIPDAGNFLFGVAAGRVGANPLLLNLGAQLNEFGKDTDADKRAYLSGYVYNSYIRGYHNSKHYGFGSFFKYDTSYPKWFSPKNNTIKSDFFIRNRE